VPYVNIKITREGATPAQKAALIEGVTNLLRDTLGKNPNTTVVVIDEVEMDNWGIGSVPVEQFRSRGRLRWTPTVGQLGTENKLRTESSS